MSSIKTLLLQKNIEWNRQKELGISQKRFCPTENNLKCTGSSDPDMDTTQSNTDMDVITPSLTEPDRDETSENSTKLPPKKSRKLSSERFEIDKMEPCQRFTCIPCANKRRTSEFKSFESIILHLMVGHEIAKEKLQFCSATSTRNWTRDIKRYTRY